jgi:hypothetical protein
MNATEMNVTVLMILMCSLPLGARGEGPATRDEVLRFAPSALGLLSVAAAAADPAVESGRKGLDHWWRYPWYDAQSDGARRIDLTPPRSDKLPSDGGGTANSAAFEGLLQCGIWLGLGLLLAAIVYSLVQAYQRRGRATARTKGPSADTADPDRIEALPFPLHSGRGDLLDEARRHHEQGNYARAIVYLFSYQLVQLDKQQVIRLARGKTNRQYLREIGTRPPLVRLMEQTMVAFEDVFFGNRPLERARFESCWSRLEEFQSLLAAGQA